MTNPSFKRLNQAAKDLNIGLTTIVNFLAEKGFYIENKPTTILTTEQIAILNKAFSNSIQDLNTETTTVNREATTLDSIIRERKRIGQPNSFFKYFGTSDFHFESLEKNYIYFSPPSYFNDPYDCNQDLIVFPTGKSKNNKLITRFRNNLSTIGICCFSTVKDSILLWSHYANSHKGFCLEFSFPTSDPNGIHPLPVCYSDSFQKLSFQAERDDSIFNMIYTKSREWSYEKEWRVLKTGLLKNSDRKINFNQIFLKSIYLGIKCENETIEKIKNICKAKYPNIKIHQAFKCNESFKIDFNELSF
ncbi:DUF2971 domain-containing protein [Hymenobacter sp. NST-14]|uniref:DUF2971 domain-containing protein n=1 Tax=Hymenobacter piscis TaxID=2839984 RepID=UPI001C0260CD|nr:DUF2971 domain-containing protein [Hymenobacter piscis]MBT9392852.1 DUF2971 domain-containing protein [Hymenobacter piscis]